MSEVFTVKSIFRNYQVQLIDGFEKSIFQHSMQNSFILVDQNLLALFEKQFASILPQYHHISIEANETNKTMDYCQNLIIRLIELGIRKNSTIIAVGGGIVQDIAAFTSSILFRGVKWMFYPTTLLAQADSCIGSKTSINLGNKKNLVGSFYPPSQVYIDAAFLNSLPVADLKSGIGEILHYYIYADSPLIRPLMDNYEDVLATPGLFVEHIKASLAIKKEVIEKDEFDRGERNKFNYGHTFGHAIETMTHYGVSHGQAVTLGMDIANYISEKMGYMDKETFNAMHSLLLKNLPEINLRQYNLNTYFRALSKDKKNIENDLVCILATENGSLKKIQMPFNDNLKNLIISYFEGYAC